MENNETFSMELEQFNLLVDNAIKKLEEESEDTPAKKENTALEADSLNDENSEFTSLEIEEMDMLAEADLAAVSLEKELSKADSGHIVTTSPGKVRITDNTTGDWILYANAVDAANNENLNPTTVRSRCKGGKIDSEGRVWEYVV